MAQEGFKRRLSAILSADVKGYSHMMRDEENATIRTMTTSLNAILIRITTRPIQFKHFRGAANPELIISQTFMAVISET